MSARLNIAYWLFFNDDKKMFKPNILLIGNILKMTDKVSQNISAFENINEYL